MTVRPCTVIAAVALPFILLGITAGAQPVGSGKTNLSKRDEAASFLKQHVIGKTVKCSLVHKIASEQIEIVFERSTAFSNLVEMKNGLSFDEYFIIKHFIFDLDKAGNRLGDGRTAHRWGVVRTQVSTRKSTDLMFGTATLVATNTDEYIGLTTGVRLEIKDANLVINSSTIGANDHFAGNGKLKPGISEIQATYSSVNGKLLRDQVEKNFYLDLKTGTKEPAGEPIKIQDVISE